MTRLPNKIYHGAAYYPEVWDIETIRKDIVQMKKLGINVVRIAEFAWCLLEPEEDVFNIGLFDEAIEEFAKNGIETIMCTPTATPPRWFTKKYPESLILDRWMNRAHHGSREHVCFSDPDYLRRSRIIVNKLGEHYGKNPHVIAWQLHNEYNCPPVSECVCDNCEKAYREWLKKKYGTIEKLNEEWNSTIWSTRYNSFDCVIAPRPTPNGHSASMSTNYTLFTFDNVSRYNKMQVDILKKYVKVPITHNTNRVFHIDQEDIFKELDFVSFDSYVTQDRYPEICFEVEMSRCLIPGVPFWEMETSCGTSANLHGRSPLHKPGFVKATAVNQFLAGSQGFSYWLFRQHRGGTEMPHAHVVTSFGTLSATAVNVLDVKNEIEKLTPFLTTTQTKQAEVALLYTDKGRAFVTNETLGGNNYLNDMVSVYDSLLKTSIYRDIIYPHNSFKGYQVIIIPYVAHLTDELVQKIVDAAKEGATVIVGPYSGYRTNSHAYYTKNAFGPIEKYFKEAIIDWDHTLGQDATYEAFGLSVPLENYACVIEKGVGEIKGGYFTGKSLISENAIGLGKIVFVGTRFHQELQDKLVEHYLTEKINKKVMAEKSIIVYERQDEKDEYLCLINMGFEEAKFEIIKGVFEDCFNQNIIKKGSLAPCDYLILRKR
ncbi:MAG: beta-galactosidase [Bacilli bacterium]